VAHKRDMFDQGFHLTSSFLVFVSNASATFVATGQITP
jgi:hypothetical protein